MPTIAGLFENLAETQAIVRTLVDQGFSNQNISLIASDPKGEYTYYQTDDQATLDQDDAVIRSVPGGGVLTEDQTSSERRNKVFASAAQGSRVGGTLGIVLGITSVTIPGIGPIVLAGSAGHLVFALLSTITGTGVGTLIGAFTGALKDERIAEREAHTYVEWLRRGGALVLVKTDEAHEEQVSNLMREAGAVETHTAEWHQHEGEDLVTPVEPGEPTWEKTSKVGTTAGAATGAATGAVAGSFAGPAGTLGGGAIGAAAGAAVGAVGDVGGKQLEEQQNQISTQKEASEKKRESSDE